MSYYDDVFDRVRRRAHRIMRDILSGMDEMEAWFQSMFDELESEFEHGRLLDDTLSDLKRGVLRPLVSFNDLGQELMILVDLPGSDLEHASIDLTPTSISVRANIRSEFVNRAFGQASWARRVSMYEGEYQLPCPVDPNTAKVNKKNGLIVIRVRKASRPPVSP